MSGYVRTLLGTPSRLKWCVAQGIVEAFTITPPLFKARNGSMRSEKKAVWLRIFSKSLLRTQSPDAVWSTPSKRLNLGCALDNKLLRFYCVNHTKVFSHLMLQIVHYWSDIISTSLVPALLHFHFKERLRSLCSVLYRCHGLELLMQNSNAHGVKPIATKALWPRRETFAWFSFFFFYSSRKTLCCIVPNIFIFFFFCI